MASLIRGTIEGGPSFVWEVNPHLRPIYDLLANGVNQQVILVKDDGKRFIYELED